jgi:hypothetical protein
VLQVIHVYSVTNKKGDNMQKYNKTIAALVTGLLSWGAVVVASVPQHITSSEWLGLGGIVATALGVYAVVNVSDPQNTEPVLPDPIAEAPQAPAESPAI